MDLFISPHNDDETLFGAYTIIRNKPLVLVVTDSFIQPNRGDIGCDADNRWQETCGACKILGSPVARGGIRDDSIGSENVEQLLKRFEGFERIFIPAIQGGNWQHDLISKVAQDVFGSSCIQYTTYTKTQLWTRGNIEIIPTKEEIEIKKKALSCYLSQIRLPSTRPHFESVINKSEWIL